MEHCWVWYSVEHSVFSSDATSVAYLVSPMVAWMAHESVVQLEHEMVSPMVETTDEHSADHSVVRRDVQSVDARVQKRVDPTDDKSVAW